MQAAILIEKLKIFPDELAKRSTVAERYNEHLIDVCAIPVLREGNTSAWAQYTLRLARREEVQDSLRQKGIPSVVYYPIPLSRQVGYEHFPTVSSGLDVSDRLAETVLSLPMHPYLGVDEQTEVAMAVKAALR